MSNLDKAVGSPAMGGAPAQPPPVANYGMNYGLSDRMQRMPVGAMQQGGMGGVSSQIQPYNGPMPVVGQMQQGGMGGPMMGNRMGGMMPPGGGQQFGQMGMAPQPYGNSKNGLQSPQQGQSFSPGGAKGGMQSQQPGKFGGSGKFGGGGSPSKFGGSPGKMGGQNGYGQLGNQMSGAMDGLIGGQQMPNSMLMNQAMTHPFYSPMQRMQA